MTLQWLGLLCITTIALVAAMPVFKGPLDWQDSVSITWSRSRKTWLATAITMSLAGTGLCTSLAFWLIPHYKLPIVSYCIIAMAYIAFMCIAWVPMTEQPGEHSYLHGHFLGGATLATLAVAALAIIVWSGVGISPIVRIFGVISMIITASWPSMFFGPTRRIFLLHESAIAILFCTTTILLLIG